MADAGQLHASSSNSQSPPPLPASPWWQFWRWQPEAVLAGATAVLAAATIVLAAIAGRSSPVEKPQQPTLKAKSHEMQHRNNNGSRKDAAENDHEKAPQISPVVLEEKAKHRWLKTKHYWYKWESWMGLAMLVAVIFYTCTTYSLWQTQLTANRINTEMYVAQSRPWVMLDDIKPYHLDLDDAGGVVFWVYLPVKNVGHSPAQNVSVSGELLINNDNALRSDQAMAEVCRGPRSGSFTIPGQVLFPGQPPQNVDREVPTGFGIPAELVWAARDARIKSVYNRDKNVERARARAEAISEFPFNGALYFVGCINYRSADNGTLYQTSFMFDLSSKPNGNGFPLLSGEPIKDLAPTPDPYDPDVLVVHARRGQRMVPGDQIKIGTPLYGSFAS